MLLPVALAQLLLLLHTSAVSSSPMVELSMFFSVNTSSGSNCSAPSCSLHCPMKMLDSNLSTWWQSQDGEQPVLVELQALHNVSVYNFSELKINVLAPLPMTLSVHADDELILDCSPHANDSKCSPLLKDDVQSAVLVVYLEENFQTLEILLDGFSNHSSDYFAVAELSISGHVQGGFFLPGAHSIRAEAEEATLLPEILVSSDTTMFPEYSGRGYAVINYPINTNPMIMLELQLPHTAQYTLVAHYSSLRLSSFPVIGTIRQGSTTQDIRFVLSGSGSCSPDCYTAVDFLTDNGTSIAYFPLVSSKVIITLTLDGVQALLDYITAIPEPFISGSNLPIPSNYITLDCNVIDNTLQSGSTSYQQCIQQLLQISANFYFTPQVCQCSTYALHDNCAVLGGLCDCATSVLGRRCDTCQFYQYLNSTHCSACDCPDGGMCPVATGQCQCQPNVEGRRCDQCVEGSDGSPPDNCTMSSLTSSVSGSSLLVTTSILLLQPPPLPPPPTATGRVNSFTSAHFSTSAVQTSQLMDMPVTSDLFYTLSEFYMDSTTTVDTNTLFETGYLILDMSPTLENVATVTPEFFLNLATSSLTVEMDTFISSTADNGATATPDLILDLATSSLTVEMNVFISSTADSFASATPELILDLATSSLIVEMDTFVSSFTTASKLVLQSTVTSTELTYATSQDALSSTSKERTTLPMIFSITPEQTSASPQILPSYEILSPTLTSIYMDSSTSQLLMPTSTNLLILQSTTNDFLAIDVMTTTEQSFALLVETYSTAENTSPEATYIDRTPSQGSQSISTRPFMIPSPGLANLVVATLIIPRVNYDNLLNNQSTQRSLETALTSSYIKAINKFSRSARHTSFILSKIQEVRSQGNNNHTPIIFYVVANNEPLPAQLVAAIYNHASTREIAGYDVVSIKPLLEELDVPVIIGGALGAVILCLALLLLIVLLFTAALWHRKKKQYRLKARRSMRDIVVQPVESPTRPSPQRVASTVSELIQTDPLPDRDPLVLPTSFLPAEEAESDEEHASARLFENVTQYAGKPSFPSTPKMKYYFTSPPVDESKDMDDLDGDTALLLGQDNSADPPSKIDRTQPIAKHPNKVTHHRFGRNLRAMPFFSRLTNFSRGSRVAASDALTELFLTQTNSGVQLVSINKDGSFHEHDARGVPSHPSSSPPLVGTDASELVQQAFTVPDERQQSFLGASHTGVAASTHNTMIDEDYPYLQPGQGQLVWAPVISDPSLAQSQPVDALQLTRLRNASDKLQFSSQQTAL